MKQYKEEKHFDLGLCLNKGQAYFEGIEFAENCSSAIKNIINKDIPDITFDNCIFTNLDLRGQTITPKISFINCTFKSNSSFENAVFKENVSFDNSSFIGITDFSNATFCSNASFNQIKTKPASGQFYFRGDKMHANKTSNYYKNSFSFAKAVFETEVSFLGRVFEDNLSFQGCEFHNKFWFTNTNVGLKSNFHSIQYKCDGIKDIDICYRILADTLKTTGSAKRQAKEVEMLEEIAFKKEEAKNDVFKPQVQNKANNSGLLDTNEAANYLGLQKNTLEKWRTTGLSNLKYIKIGRVVKYRLEDLQEFISCNKN